MVYTVKKLADLAGVSIRTLHYYDEIGLLKPQSHSASGYRYYGEEAVVRLQQIMFFRELGFGLDEIKKIVSRQDFDVLKALQSHRTLLMKKADRIGELLATIDKTIRKLKGAAKMQIKEYYKGFSNGKIEKYREEVRRRWGEKTLQESEARVIRMGKENLPPFRLKSAGYSRLSATICLQAMTVIWFRSRWLSGESGWRTFTITRQRLY